MKRIFLFFLLLTGSESAILAQLTNEETKKEGKKPIEELRLKLNEDGSHYIKATFLNQTWFRYAEYNPGTTVLSTPTSEGFDIGLRRTRFQLYGQLTDHVTFYFQLGQNNFNFLSGNGGVPDNNSANVNRKTQFFIHDAMADYRIKKGSDVLYLGGGLTIANGLSRFSQPSIGSIMSMDVPVFAQATVDQTDEFSRKLSLFARGQIGKLDYRVVLSDPFPLNTNGSVTVIAPPNSSNAAFALDNHHKQYQGFFIWNFFEKESHVTPYMTGTYLGKKKVLNLEAGFITHKSATWTGDGTVAGTQYHDMNLWSVAMYYDAPGDVEKGTAWSAYFGYFSTDYGPGYLRYNASMNPANGITSPVTGPSPANSQGTAFPMFGTGNVIYAQVGYLMKKDLLGEGNGTLMPYATFQSAKYGRLDNQMNVYNIGVNWLIKGHTSKITLDYQIRPTYTPNGTALNLDSSTKNQVLVQYQFFF
ncbi:hypothetical protein WSM22_28880 [Cytophagales bacterium WSM2-2]|nr:hypothetical protein WSM22_28880 [Cytophagales bacterium WSM2-2]